jgi:hypothetical protein
MAQSKDAFNQLSSSTIDLAKKQRLQTTAEQENTAMEMRRGSDEWKKAHGISVGGGGGGGTAEKKLTYDYTAGVNAMREADAAAAWKQTERESNVTRISRELNLADRAVAARGATYKPKEEKSDLQKELEKTAYQGISDGVSAALSEEEPAKAFGKVLFTATMTAISLALAAIPGIGPALSAIAMGIGTGMANRLFTGGTYNEGRFRSFATGGADFGTYVGSPTYVFGAKNNALIGDVSGGEVIQNIPQIRNMIAAVAEAVGSGGGTTNIYTQGLVGQAGVADGVYSAYQNGARSRGRVKRGAKR